MFYKKRINSGFTLIELLVVIAIIGVLSSVVMANLNSARQKARDIQRLSDMKQIRNALELFMNDKGHYPAFLTEGVSNSGEMIGVGGPIDGALKPYLSSIPKDPLHDGVVYYYSYDSVHCYDDPLGSCNCAGLPGQTDFNKYPAIFGFNKAETKSFKLQKDTCSGNDMNLANADYNVALYPILPWY